MGRSTTLESTRPSVRKPTFLLAIVTTYGLLCCGCATGPRYTYTQQKDSASVSGPITPFQNRDNGTCSIRIVQVDGLTANFDASSPGINWPTSKKSLYLEPGKHVLALDIGEIDTETGDTGHGASGITGAVASGSTPTINVEFKANHTYRFAAYLVRGWIDLTLWDETDGAKTRSEVANWTFDSNSNYSDSSAPSGGRK